jgi:hypothetical protein
LTRLWTDFGGGNLGRETIERLDLLHVLCSILTRHRKALNLSEHVCGKLNVAPPPPTKARSSIESWSVENRHQLLQMAAWLLTDLPGRLEGALRDHGVRFNHLMRDFRHLPAGYRSTVQALPHRVPKRKRVKSL